MCEDFNLEISGFPTDGGNFGESYKLNIQMPADLDQFRRNDSHGAVIGRESLVQFGHDPTNAGRFFKEMNIVSGICKIKR